MAMQAPSATLKSRLFTKIAQVAMHLPRVKGKNGVFLRLFDLLGLRSEHILVEVDLNAPLKYRVRLDLHSWLQRLAFVSGEYESDTVHFLAKLRKSLSNSGYVLDIGANIGLIGIPLGLMIGRDADSMSGPAVVCIEAVPDNEKALRHNIALNAAERAVVAIGTGLGEQSGMAEIQVEGDLDAGEGTGTANVLPAGSSLDPNRTYECVKFPISITTLDELFSEGMLHGRCSVIKIDTDGYDLKILKGARAMLERDRPVIYGEFMANCLKWHGESIADVVRFAESIDYLVWQRASRKALTFSTPVNSDSFVQDALLVPRELAGTLAWCHAT